jgi:hypothetical protein
MVLLLAVVALPAAAAEVEAVNLPGWFGGLMALVAVLLPLLVWSRLRSRGQL